MAALIANAELFAWTIIAVLAIGALGLLYAYFKPFADLVAAALTAVLRFAGTRMGQITIGVLIAIGSLYGGAKWFFHKGYTEASAKYEAQLAEEKARVAAEVEKRRQQVATFVLQATAAGDRADKAERERDAARAAKANVITKEIPRYVTAAADARCLIPRGFVYLHDAIRAGGVPAAAAPAGLAVDEPSTVALSDLARNDAETVRLYDACRDQVAGMQKWYGEVRESFATMRGAE